MPSSRLPPPATHRMHTHSCLLCCTKASGLLQAASSFPFPSTSMSSDLVPARFFNKVLFRYMLLPLLCLRDDTKSSFSSGPVTVFTASLQGGRVAPWTTELCRYCHCVAITTDFTSSCRNVQDSSFLHMPSTEITRLVAELISIDSTRHFVNVSSTAALIPAL